MICDWCKKTLNPKEDKKAKYHLSSSYCQALVGARVKRELEPSTTPVYGKTPERKWKRKSLMNTFVYK